MRDRAFVLLVALVVLMGVALLTQSRAQAEGPAVGRYQVSVAMGGPDRAVLWTHTVLLDTETGHMWGRTSGVDSQNQSWVDEGLPPK